MGKETPRARGELPRIIGAKMARHRTLRPRCVWKASYGIELHRSRMLFWGLHSSVRHAEVVSRSWNSCCRAWLLSTGNAGLCRALEGSSGSDAGGSFNCCWGPAPSAQFPAPTASLRPVESLEKDRRPWVVDVVLWLPFGPRRAKFAGLLFQVDLIELSWFASTLH